MGLKWYAKINEKVAAPAAVVGGALIESGSYEEEYIDDSEKYDEINIKFLNSDNKYIEDSVGHASDKWDDPTEYDIFKSKTALIKGITSKAHAQREAILRLQQIQSINKRVRFIMDVDAINYEVGDVIKVQHNSNRYSFSRICTGVTYENEVYTIMLDAAIDDAPSNMWGDDAVIAWRKNSDDTWDEIPVATVSEKPEGFAILSTAACDAVEGDPVFIGRASTATHSDFDLIRVEEMNLMGDMKVEIVGYNYDPDVYTHTDYGTTAI